MTLPFRLLPIDAEPDRPLRAWQAVAVPKVLDAIARQASGIVVAVTGSGKSVLLAEVIAQVLRGNDAALVVVTTSSRRLVEQIAQTIGERIGAGRVGRYYTSAKEADRPVVVACNNSALALAAVLRRHGRVVALWVADEAHRTEAEGLTVASHALQPEARVGFTATAFRSDDSQNLQLFEEVIHRYGFGDALRDKVIVPWKVIPWTLAEMPLDDAVLQMIREHGDGPGVVNANTIEDAETFAAWLTEQGVEAAAVHSELAPATQDARLAALKSGDLRVIVYPSLLSEGADFPWLRWMCLRRKVSARVRFIQEVGRVLRTHPGKSEAIILDPLGLFNTFSLSYDEDLGEKEVEPAADPEERESSGGSRSVLEAMARPADAVASWARQLYLAAQLDGVVEERPSFTFDRSGPASPAQCAAVKKMAWAARWLPPEHYAVVTHLAHHGDLPNVGAAGDVLNVLGGMCKRKARWVPSLPVLAPDQELLAQVRLDLEAGGWFSAGAFKGGVRAIVVVHGQRLVASGVKSDETESNPTAVQVAAARTCARHAGDGQVVHLSDEWAFKVLTGLVPARHSAVTAAMQGACPDVQYKLVEASKNPASGMAWREVQRARKAS